MKRKAFIVVGLALLAGGGILWGTVFGQNSSPDPLRELVDNSDLIVTARATVENVSAVGDRADLSPEVRRVGQVTRLDVAEVLYKGASLLGVLDTRKPIFIVGTDAARVPTTRDGLYFLREEECGYRTFLLAGAQASQSQDPETIAAVRELHLKPSSRRTSDLHCAPPRGTKRITLLGPVLKDKDLRFEASLVRCSSSNLRDPDTALRVDGAYCTADLRVTNLSAHPVRLAWAPQRLRLEREAVEPWIDAMTEIVGDDPGNLFTSPLRPGDARTGTLFFAIAEKDRPTALELRAPGGDGVTFRIRCEGDGAPRCSPTEPHTTTTRTAGEAVVVCDSTSIRLLTPLVRAQRNGVHVLVRNLDLGDAAFEWSPSHGRGGGGGGGGTNLSARRDRFVLDAAPGPLSLACAGDEYMFDVDPPEVVVEVVDPHRVFRSANLDCKEYSIGMSESLIGRGRGQRGDPVELTREHGYRSTDEVMRVGYPGRRSVAKIAVVRDGKTIAVVEWWREGRGRWVLDSETRCSPGE